MGTQDLIALGIVAVAVVYAGRSILHTLRGQTGCGGGCGCSKDPSEAQSDRGLKQIPLVQLGSSSKEQPPVDGVRPPKS
jgi:hypothetical protein